MTGSPEYAEVTDLPGSDALRAAGLACLAFEDFYSHITSDRARLLAAIAKQFQASSELNQLVTVRVAGRIEGIGAYYDLRETASRQMEGMRMLLEAADDVPASARALRAFARNFPPAGDAGGYISRFAVAPEARGGPIASGLLDRVESALRGLGLGEVRLHVRRDNARAIGFYRKRGFAPCGTGDLGYLLLRKPLA